MNDSNEDCCANECVCDGFTHAGCEAQTHTLLQLRPRSMEVAAGRR